MLRLICSQGTHQDRAISLGDGDEFLREKGDKRKQQKRGKEAERPSQQTFARAEKGMGWRLFDSSWWKEGRNLTPHRLSSGERKPKSVVTSGAGLFILHLLPSSIVTIGCIGLLRPKEDLSMGSGVMPPDDQHFRSSHVSPATGHFLSQHCVILMRVSLCISCILHERGKEEGKFSNHSHCQTGRYFLI